MNYRAELASSLEREDDALLLALSGKIEKARRELPRLGTGAAMPRTRDCWNGFVMPSRKRNRKSPPRCSGSLMRIGQPEAT